MTPKKENCFALIIDDLEPLPETAHGLSVDQSMSPEKFHGNETHEVFIKKNMLVMLEAGDQKERKFKLASS